MRWRSGQPHRHSRRMYSLLSLASRVHLRRGGTATKLIELYFDGSRHRFSVVSELEILRRPSVLLVPDVAGHRHDFFAVGPDFHQARALTLLRM